MDNDKKEEAEFKTADEIGSPGVKENVADIVSLAGYAWGVIEKACWDLPEAAKVATLETVLQQNTRHLYYVQQALANGNKTGKAAEATKEDDLEDAWKRVIENGKLDSAKGDKRSDKQSKCLYAIGKKSQKADLRIMDACEMWHLDDTRDMTFVQANNLIDWLKKAGY